MILDTNALSAWADGDPAIAPHLKSATRLELPSIILGEYLFGIAQSRHKLRYEQWLADYLPTIEMAVVGQRTAREYADVRLELKRHGSPIPANDAWIAALARQHDLPILSNDIHLDLLPKLRRIGF